jgi:hypothetical protein
MALSLVLVGPALATMPLHQPVPIDWNDAGSQGTGDDCTGLNLEPGQVLWHFILSKSTTSDPTMTATFADASFNVTDLPPTQISPDSLLADHWTIHWDVITNQTTLTGASTSGTGNEFNLSHICAGGPPPDVPEAPAAALLLLAGGVGLFGFFLMRQRRGGVVA